MNKLAAMLCAIAILALPAAAVATDGQPEPTPAPQKKDGKVVAQAMVAENATVKAIDTDKRTVTLLLSDGREQTFVIDKAVRKLGQVKVGDIVKARYHEAVSIKINKVKVAPGVKVEETLQPDEKSVKPAGTTSLRATTTATIDRIFDEGRMVTLRLPDGKTADVRVRDPENRAKIEKGEVKEGDQIEITYNRAVAIAVEKAPQK